MPLDDDHLPEPLRRFARRCLIAPPAEPRRALIEQRGEMRLKADGKWMPFSAEQSFAPDEVAFRWHARVRMAPLLTAVVEDAFEHGHGRLEAKVWGLLPVADADGPEIDRGEAQRYLAELPWNPLALVHNRQLQFADGEDGSIRVWAFDPDTHVDLHFDATGDIVRAHTRTRTRDHHPHPWQGQFSDYRQLGDVRLPTQAHVSWLMPDGEFCYWRGEVTAASWDTAQPRARSALA